MIKVIHLPGIYKYTSNVFCYVFVIRGLTKATCKHEGKKRLYIAEELWGRLLQNT